MTNKNQLNLLFIITIVSLVVASCASISFPNQATPTPDFSDLEIVLERGMCFGPCPVYELRITGDGKGIYQGKYYVSVKGEQTFLVTNEQLHELLEAFEQADFYSLEDEYIAQVLEQSDYKVSISYLGKTKTVWHYGSCVTPVANPTPGQPDIMMNKGGAPQSLCELEDKIDRILNSSQWVGEKQ